MNTHIEKMKAVMFPAEGTNVVNVKFFLGSDRRVSADQLAVQLDRADAQIRSGAATRSHELDGHLTVKTL